MINKEKTEINIKGKIYTLSDIELITVKENFLLICYGDEIIRCPSASPESDIKQIGVLMYLAQIQNYLLWFGGNNIINKDKIVSIAYDDDLVNANLQTKNHSLTLNNLSGVEFLIVKRILKENNSKEAIK